MRLFLLRTLIAIGLAGFAPHTLAAYPLLSEWKTQQFGDNGLQITVPDTIKIEEHLIGTLTAKKGKALSFEIYYGTNASKVRQVRYDNYPKPIQKQKRSIKGKLYDMVILPEYCREDYCEGKKYEIHVPLASGGVGIFSSSSYKGGSRRIFDYIISSIR